MRKLTVDGVEVEVPAGAKVLQARELTGRERHGEVREAAE